LKLVSKIFVCLKLVNDGGCAALRFETKMERARTMPEQRLSLDAVEDLARIALEGAGAAAAAASSVAHTIRLAERDGIRGHGLLYVPIYAQIRN
jgi:hypothetical protein